jgi:hypothetical protein
MGNLDSDGIGDFLINRANAARADLVELVDNYHAFCELSTDQKYRRKLSTQVVNAKRMHQVLNNAPAAQPSALGASNIALDDNHPLQQQAKLFVGATVDRQYEDISQAMHLRMREILQRYARRNLGKDAKYLPWYKQSIILNYRLRQTL